MNSDSLISSLNVAADSTAVPALDVEAARIAAAAAASKAALFRGLSAPSIAQIVAEAHRARFVPTESILRRGDPGDDLYLILSGAAHVQRDVDGEARTLLTLLPGHIFGELAFLGGFPRTADVVAASETELLVISRGSLSRLIETAPRTAIVLLINLAHILGERLAASTNAQTDILAASERLRAQQEADRRRTLSQMVAGVAHEINTPLGIANHAASIVSELVRGLAGASPGEMDRETLGDIEAATRLMTENIARADRLIHTFKTLSVNQAVDNLDDVNLLQITQDTVDLYRLKARASRLDIRVVDQLNGESDEWRGYPGHYAQIMLNLLTNVDRYAYPEDVGGPVEIEIGLERAPAHEPRYRIVVRDFGCGVAPANVERVFEPFFTTGRSKGGTGLGLPIVKNLVTESLRGEIALVSRLGAGAEFRILVPRLVVPHEDDRA
jgi:signal transduction histidine kinase